MTLNLNEHQKIYLVVLVTAKILIVLALLQRMMTEKDRFQLSIRQIGVYYTGGSSSLSELEKVITQTSNTGYVRVKNYAKLTGRRPHDWKRMIELLETDYHALDAIVIVHPLETIPYLASALAWGIDNLHKPIIITDGSYWDTKYALQLASQRPFDEVVVLHDETIRRGLRVSYQQNKLVGPAIGYRTNLEYHKLRMMSSGTPTRFTTFNPELKITYLKTFPGIDGLHLNRLTTNRQVDGLVLETERGGEYDHSPSFNRELRSLAVQGVPIVNVSARPTPQPFTDGIVNGYDMTPEGALVKMYFLIGTTPELDQLRSYLASSLRGEMTSAYPNPVINPRFADTKRGIHGEAKPSGVILTTIPRTTITDLGELI